MITFPLIVMLTKDPVLPYQLPTQPRNILSQFLARRRENIQRSPKFIGDTASAPTEEAGTSVLQQADTEQLLQAPNEDWGSGARTQYKTDLTQSRRSVLLVFNLCFTFGNVKSRHWNFLLHFPRNIADW